jgi:hypothetical protein
MMTLGKQSVKCLPNIKGQELTSEPLQLRKEGRTCDQEKVQQRLEDERTMWYLEHLAEKSVNCLGTTGPVVTHQIPCI